jgi:hypothetical protein
VWNQQRGKEPLFVWKGIPPSPDFVCLGMIATTTEDVPSRTLIRCVPRAWCAPAKKAPKLMWDDSGSGGRAGSIWAINSMGLMAVTQGHLPPSDEFLDIASHRFFLGPADYQLSVKFAAEQQNPVQQALTATTVVATSGAQV